MTKKSISFTPTSVDILCGYGYRAAHPGNVRFKHIVATHFDEYCEAVSKTGKMRVSKAILNEILRSGARFLKKDDSRRLWHAAGLKAGKDKISHVLREMKRARDRATRQQDQSQQFSPNGIDVSKRGRQHQQATSQQGQQQLATAQAAVCNMDAASSISSRSELTCRPEQRHASRQPPSDTTRTGAQGGTSGCHYIQTASDIQATALYLQQANGLPQQWLPKNGNNPFSDDSMNNFMCSFSDEQSPSLSSLKDNVFAGNHQQRQESGNDSDDRNGCTSEDSGSRYSGSDESRNMLLKACIELAEDSPPNPSKKSG